MSTWISRQTRLSGGVRSCHGHGIGSQDQFRKSWNPRQGGKGATWSGRKAGRYPGLGPELQAGQREA